MEFDLKHREGKLIAVVTIDGKEHEKDVTEFFEDEYVLMEWENHRRRFGINGSSFD